MLMVNITNPKVPNFYLTGLKPDTGYVITIIASNPKGYSDRRVLQAFTIKSDGLTQLIETNESALATNMDDVLPINPFLIISLIVIGVFMSLFLPITILVCIRKRKQSLRSQSNNQTASNSSNIANTARNTPNKRLVSLSKGTNFKLPNDRDIFSEFEDTGSSISGNAPENDKRAPVPDTTAGPDLIPSYTSIHCNEDFILGKHIYYSSSIFMTNLVAVLKH